MNCRFGDFEDCLSVHFLFCTYNSVAQITVNYFVNLAHSKFGAEKVFILIVLQRDKRTLLQGLYLPWRGSLQHRDTNHTGDGSLPFYLYLVHIDAFGLYPSQKCHSREVTLSRSRRSHHSFTRTHTHATSDSVRIRIQIGILRRFRFPSNKSS